MLRKVFRWFCIVICALLVLFGAFLHYAHNVKDSAFLIWLGIGMPILYYGYIREGSKGKVWMTKFLQTKKGMLFLIILVITAIILKIFKV